MAFSLAIVTFLEAHSQPAPPVCDSECDWSGAQQQTRRVELRDPDCYVDVVYRRIICNGVIKFVIDDYTVVDGCLNQWGGLSGLMEQHKSYSALLDYITMGLVSQGLTSSSVPPCSTGAYQSFTDVYTASCGVWAYCDYEINENATPTCVGWQGPPPTFGAPKKVRVSKWQSCGTTCCKRTYRTCRGSHPDTGESYTKIERTGPPVQVGDCTLKAQFAPLPCQSGCGE